MISPTKNLKIRPFEESDMPILKRWFYSGEYPEFFRDMLALTEAQLKIYSYMKDGQGFIVWDYHDKPVGFIILYEMRVVPANVKLAILIDESYQRKGYCIQSMISICDYVFNRLRMEKLIVEVLELNPGIQHMLKEGGFEKECVLVNEAKLDGNWHNVARYMMFREKYVEYMSQMAMKESVSHGGV